MSAEHSVAPPRIVAWLGYGGLIPFVALAPASLLDHHHGALWSEALLAYGATILSFVGALHWGMAMSQPGFSERQRVHCFIWSVVPALIAWPSVLLPSMVGVPLLIFGFVAHFQQDWRLARQVDLPGWYLPLRMQLSCVAVVCLLVGLFSSRV